MLKSINNFVKNTKLVTTVKTLSKQSLVVTLSLAALLFVNTATAENKLTNKLTKPIDQLEWIKGAEGLYFALAWGDWTKEDTDYGMIVKIEAGVELPRHSHTHDYHGMTIQGTWVHSYAKGDDKVLPPGSYAFQAGKENHGDRCEGTVDCLLLIHQHGPRDFFPEK